MFRCLIAKLLLCGCQSFIKESYYYYYYYYCVKTYAHLCHALHRVTQFRVQYNCNTADQSSDRPADRNSGGTS